MNRRQLIKSAFALSVSVVIPKAIASLPISDELEFKSVSMWVNGAKVANVEIYDFALTIEEIRELSPKGPIWEKVANDWHHIVLTEEP